MRIKVYKDYNLLSHSASAEILRLVQSKPDACICLAAGDSPRLAYQLLVDKVLEASIDFSRITFIGLDEWVGVAPANEGSCNYFLHTSLINHLNYSSTNIHLFDSLAVDLWKECQKMDVLIKDKGGIDLMLVGVGMNGHVGFNEPGTSFNKYSHVVELDKVSSTVGQKYFKETTVLKQGISLGLKHLSESKKVLMLANGFKKAPVIKKVLEEAISEQMPASIIRTHTNSEVMLDEEAASLLTK